MQSPQVSVTIFDSFRFFIFTSIILLLCEMPKKICMFTISFGKYLPVYIALGPVECQFTHMDKSHFYLASQLPCLDEWREKPLGTQHTNESENASTHAVSEMISFNISLFHSPGALLDFRLLTAHFIFPDLEREQGCGPHLWQMTTGDIALIERVTVSPVFPRNLAAHLFQEHTQIFF